VRTARLGRRGEAGVTLIEMIVTIAIVAVAIVGITGGFAALERITGINQQQSSLEVAARQLNDFLRSQKAVQYTPCATPGSYTLPTKPTGITSWSITSVQESLTRNGVATGYIQACGGSPATYDWGVQEITISVSNAQRSLTRIVWKGTV
jgi:prepilin-type N-terminal cleavage/methylation domain-containing protein